MHTFLKNKLLPRIVFPLIITSKILKDKNKTDYKDCSSMRLFHSSVKWMSRNNWAAVRANEDFERMLHVPALCRCNGCFGSSAGRISLSCRATEYIQEMTDGTRAPMDVKKHAFGIKCARGNIWSSVSVVISCAIKGQFHHLGRF